jgi:hypothetical protein
MKAFVAAMLAMIAIAVGAHYYLDSLGLSSAETYKSGDVRLGG